MKRAAIALAVLLVLAGAVRAGTLITSATVAQGGDTNSAVTGDTGVVINDPNLPDPYDVPVFGEDVLAFMDRDHEYNGATGAGLPAYLVGGDYVICQNNARDDNPFELQVTLGSSAYLYVIRDTRAAGSTPAWFSDGAGLDFSPLGALTPGGNAVGYDEDGVANGTTGPGNSIQNTGIVYMATDTASGQANLAAGTYSLYESDTSGKNMYGVVASLTEAESEDALDPGEWININFQPDGADIPDGYEPDYGAVFGDRGNGLSYGWDEDTSDRTRDRNNAAAPDQRYDTLDHMTKNDADRVWELALDNGTYDLEIVCGDPSHTDMTQHIDVEGIAVTDPDGEDFFDTYILEDVVVADGRLTIRPGAGSDNPKIAFLHITPEPATLALMGLGLAGLLFRRRR